MKKAQTVLLLMVTEGKRDFFPVVRRDNFIIIGSDNFTVVVPYQSICLSFEWKITKLAPVCALFTEYPNDTVIYNTH